MTKPIGSFGEALLRAMGIVSAHEGTSLHRVTDAALAKHKPSLAKATDAVERATRNEGGMLLELLDDARFTRPLVEKFVARRAAHIKVRLETPNGGGQKMFDDQQFPRCRASGWRGPHIVCHPSLPCPRPIICPSGQ